ncbi:phage tail protein I [Chromobacterium piscinae]|uniref:Phage tail protein I n=1 Tax=Chromobacterium piscinae TaxID=686831 RepID=A0ABV0H2L2_9NEIS
MADLPLPPALAGDERMRTLAALSARISAVELSPLLVYLVDQVSSSALPVLAEQFHMQGDEGWLLAADDEQRRQLLKRAIEWHRYKGTRWALEEIFRVLGINVELVEWWQQKKPSVVHTFRLIAWANDNRQSGQPLLNAEMYRRLQRMVDHTKPARSHYEFRLGAAFDQVLAMASASQSQAVKRDNAKCRAAPTHPINHPVQFASANRAQAVLRFTLEGKR